MNIRIRENLKLLRSGVLLNELFSYACKWGNNPSISSVICSLILCCEFIIFYSKSNYPFVNKNLKHYSFSLIMRHFSIWLFYFLISLAIFVFTYIVFILTFSTIIFSLKKDLNTLFAFPVLLGFLALPNLKLI